MSTTIGIWIASALTLCIYSFLYKDNPFYKFAEHLFVGVSAGYTVAIAFYHGFIPYIWDPLTEAVTEQEYGNYVVIIPVLLGLLIFTRFTPRYGWLIRWPFAFLMGASAGAAIPSVMQAYLFKQIEGTLQPFTSINAALIFVGVICTLIYFFFSVEHRGPIGGLSRVGIIFLMVGFGASFGYTVMARVSLLIGRMYFLLHDWLGVIE